MMDVLLELQLFEDGNGERGGLAGAGAGLADDVDFLERKRDEAGLDWRGIFVAGQLQGIEHDVREAEAFKRGLGFRRLGLGQMNLELNW